MFFVLLVVGFPLSALANQTLPSYEEVLKAQLACDEAMLKKMNFHPDRNLQMAKNSLAVIDDLVLKEIDFDFFGVRARSFELVFRGYAYFECGKPVQFHEVSTGKIIQHFVGIASHYKDPNYLDLLSYDYELLAYYPPDGRDFFVSNQKSTDQIAQKDKEGLVCLVLQSELIKNPLAVQMNKLCDGYSQQAIEMTQAEIHKWISTSQK